MKAGSSFRKILLQGVIASPGVTAKEVTPEMFSKEAGNLVEETKLRVTYVSPPRPPSPVHQGSEEASSPSASDSEFSEKDSKFPWSHYNFSGKGLKIMEKMKFDKYKGLGLKGQGILQPLKVNIRANRVGLGFGDSPPVVSVKEKEQFDEGDVADQVRRYKAEVASLLPPPLTPLPPPLAQQKSTKKKSDLVFIVKKKKEIGRLVPYEDDEDDD